MRPGASKTLIAAVACVAGASCAVAADILRPSLPAVPVAADWTGLYAGGHVGYAWDSRDATIFSPAGAALASGSTSANGIMGGGQIGYNFQVTPSWVLGLEADASGASLNSTAVGASGFGARENKINAFGTVRGRLGYAWDRFLVYGTAGYAWANQEMIRTQQIGTINGAPPGTVESASGVASGWTAGGGVEWAITPNWSFRAEYLHLDFASQSFSFPLAGQRIDATAKIDVARVGLNYFFDFSRYTPY
jgi:outer membrane immunogenic protein